MCRTWWIVALGVIVLVFLTDPAGSSIAQSISMERIEQKPVWSSDGDWIMFQAISVHDYEAAYGKPLAEYNYDIWVMDADGSNQINLTADSSFYDGLPVWSSDGRLVSFVSKRSGNLDIWVMQSDGSHPVNVTAQSLGDDLFPRWSPDGRYIAYVTENIKGVSYDIWIVEPDGQNPRKPTDGRNHLYGSVAWSPDSHAIAYADALVNPEAEDISESIEGFQPHGIVIAPLDGTEPKMLISDQRVFDVAWSSQGSVLAVTVHHNLTNDMWLVDVDGSRIVDLAAVTPGMDHYPSWSPDGSQILFVSERVGILNAWDVWIMDHDGSNPTNLTTGFGFENISPAWSPDGQKIAFSSLPADDNPLGFSLNKDIWVMASDGSNKTNLTGQ